MAGSCPPAPGYGWGFPNGNPDGYGYRDDGVYLPLWSDRTSEYYFPRYFMVPPDTLFFPTYYNAYLSRGQRYIPYAGCGGAHPAGDAPIGSAVMPPFPYDEASAIRPSRPDPHLHRERRGAAGPLGEHGADALSEGPRPDRHARRRASPSGENRRRLLAKELGGCFTMTSPRVAAPDLLCPGARILISSKGWIRRSPKKIARFLRTFPARHP